MMIMLLLIIDTDFELMLIGWIRKNIIVKIIQIDKAAIVNCIEFQTSNIGFNLGSRTLKLKWEKSGLNNTFMNSFVADKSKSHIFLLLLMWKYSLLQKTKLINY